VLVAANLAVYLGGIHLLRRYRQVAMPLIPRRWFDIPMRAALVATLVALVVSLSFRVGPTASGVLATFPIVLTSLILILHARIGGKATAALMASTFPGMLGFGLATLTLRLTVVPLGRPAALALALAVSIGWNIALYLVLHRRVRPRSASVQ
jgi:hypothetical protein